MDRHELARTIAARWMRVLGGPLEGKEIVIHFSKEGYFLDDWVTASWKLPYMTREGYVAAKARLLKQGKPIPDGEIRKAVPKNRFDSVEITVFSIPEKDHIPWRVEEEYFTRGILQALLQICYPDWTERQRVKFEERHVGKGRLRSVSIPEAILYTGLLTLTILVINMSVFWFLGWFSWEVGFTYFCWFFMIEGGFMAFIGFIAFFRIADRTIPPWERLPEDMLHPPRPTAAIALMLSGVLLILIGMFTCPPI